MTQKLQLSLCLFISFIYIELFLSKSISQVRKDLPKSNKLIMNNNIKEGLEKDKKLILNLEKVLTLVLKRNWDVQKALLDHKASTIELRKYRSKFDYNLFARPGYSVIENSPESPSSNFQGTETRQYNIETGISKKFRTGTEITIGMNGVYQNIIGAQIDAGQMGSFDFGGRGYQSEFVISLSQEILRNTFGISDRLNDKILKNMSKINKRVVKEYLANLLVKALIGYWNVLISEDSLETQRISLESTINIRDLVKRKLSLGLSEKEELLDWNSKVLQSKNAFEMAEENLYNARLAVLETLNLDESTYFEIEKILKTNPPEVTFEDSLKDAYSKRIDLANQRTLLQNSILECQIASHNIEPLIKLNISTGTMDYSEEAYYKTFDNINRQWSVSFELSYPLGNNDAEAKESEAILNYKKNYFELKRLEQKIRNELNSRVKNCNVQYTVYQKNKKSKEYSKGYYNQVLRKFKQGRYNAVKLKLALDDYINMRQQELKSLVDYNIALLRRDLARNIIFENYGIDIDSILDS